MKILFVSPILFSHFGDGVHERATLRYLSKSTHEISVIATAMQNGCNRNDLQKIPARLHIIPSIRPFIVTDIFMGFITGLLLSLLNIIRHRKTFDVIYVRGFSFALGLEMTKRIHKIPIVHKISGFISDDFISPKISLLMKALVYAIRMLEKVSLKYSDRIIVFSQIFKKEVINRYGLSIKKKILVLSVGVNLSAFSNPDVLKKCNDDARYTVGYVGSLNVYNDIETLLHAITIVKEEVPQLRLLIVTKSNTNSLCDMIKKYGLENVVHYKAVPQERVPWALSEIDVVVVPRRNMIINNLVIPLKVIEAGAAMKPVILSKLKVFETVIKDGINGLLCEPQDPEDLAEKILFLHVHKDLRHRLGKELYNFSKNYDWQTISQKLIFELETVSNCQFVT